MITFVLVSVIVLCFSFGDVSLTRGMKQVGEISTFHVKSLLRIAVKVLRSPFILLGIALEITAFLTFLTALSRSDLSYIFPLTAASDVVATLAAKYFLNEAVSRTRWIGIVIVTGGVAMISVS